MGMGMDTPAPWPLGWDNAAGCVLCRFLEPPVHPGIKFTIAHYGSWLTGILKGPASLPCSTPTWYPPPQGNHMPHTSVCFWIKHAFLMVSSSQSVQRTVSGKTLGSGCQPALWALAGVPYRNFKLPIPLSLIATVLACFRHSENTRFTRSSSWSQGAASKVQRPLLSVNLPSSSNDFPEHYPGV